MGKMGKVLEVFVHSPNYAQYGELGIFRRRVVDLVLYAWKLVPGVELHYKAPCGPAQRFQDAENRAIGPVYILGDDDYLPPLDLDVGEIRELFDLYPEFGILAIGGEVASQGLYQDKHIIEVNSAGGIRFTRTDMVKAWPATFTGDDMQYSRMIAPYRSAYLRRWRMQHLGDGYSVWQILRDQKTTT